MAISGQGNAEFVTFVGEELVWNLYENARSVACVWLTPTSATVAHPLEHGDGVQDQLVRLAPFDVCNESYATGIMFEGGVV